MVTSGVYADVPKVPIAGCCTATLIEYLVFLRRLSLSLRPCRVKFSTWFHT